MKYECVKPFSVAVFDDETGTVTDSELIIPAGQVFTLYNGLHRNKFGEIRLINEKREWIELSGEDFIEYFKPARLSTDPRPSVQPK